MSLSDLSKYRPTRGYLLARLLEDQTHDEAGIRLAQPVEAHWAEVIEVGKDFQGFLNPDRIRPGEYVYVNNTRHVVDRDNRLIAVSKQDIRVISTQEPPIR